MENNTYISATTQRKETLTTLGIGILIGCFITAFAFAGLGSADAKSDALTEVRQSQSQVYDTATKSQNVLRDAISQLEYIKASTHDSAKKLDLTRE